MSNKNIFLSFKKDKLLKSVTKRRKSSRMRSKSKSSNKKKMILEGTPEEWKRLEVIDEEGTPLSWRGMEASITKSRKNRKSSSRSVSIKNTPLVMTDSCKLLEIPDKKTECWSSTDFFVSNMLKKYIKGNKFVYNLSKYESKKSEMSCEKIREIINNLNDYKTCKTIQSIQSIIILGNVFENKHLSILEKIFQILPNVKHVEIGLVYDFEISDKMIESFAKKHIKIVKDEKNIYKIIVKRSE